MQEELRVLAARCDRWADQVREVAGTVRSAGLVEWEAPAARLFAEWVQREGRAVIAAAEEVSQVAIALRRHAEAVAETAAGVARARAGVDAGLGAVTSTLADGVRRVVP